jgi:hypothetical protein
VISKCSSASSFLPTSVRSTRRLSSARELRNRATKGAYIEVFKKLAHHLGQLYVEWEMDLFRTPPGRAVLR